MRTLPTPTRWAFFLLLALSLGAGTLALQPPASRQEEKPKAAEAKKSEKKKKDAPPGGEREPETNVRKVLSRVLRSYKNGFESLSPTSVSEQIDPQKFYDYPRFEEGVTVFLRSVSEVRLFTREVNVQVEGEKAVVIVDTELVFSRRDSTDPPETRTAQVTFDFQRTPQGWKITEINPRSVFLP